MPGLCLAGESPAIQGFSLLQKTLSSIHGQKVVQQPQQTTTSLEKPATKREREYTEEPKKRGRMDRFRGSMEEKGVKNGVKRVKRKTEERLQQQCISYPHGPSSLATEQQGQAAKRVHPTITSPLNANQSGAPCNCVSHQPAITFKRSRVGSQRY